MAASLSKGGDVSRSKVAGGGLTKVMVSLGWDERITSGLAPLARNYGINV